MPRLHAAVRPSGDTHARNRGRRSRRATLSLSLLIALAALAGCADDSGDRRFASNADTPVQEPTLPPAASPTSAQPAEALPSPSTLVDRRGAPQIGYALVDGRLQAIENGAIWAVTDTAPIAWAASPSGDRVAVLTSVDGAVFDISVLEPDGTVADEFDRVLEIDSASATPLADPDAGAEIATLSWAPQGDRLLLAHSSGVLVDLPFAGDSTTIQTTPALGSLSGAAWSPRGDVLAAVLQRPDGLGELALVDTAAQPATVEVIAPTGAGERSVLALAWEPDGSGVYYLEADGPRAQIVAWDQSSNQAAVVATGGQAGPAGTVTGFSVSPDGEAVAYAVAIPEGDAFLFSGLYVRSLSSGQVFEVPTASDVGATEIWWQSDGLGQVQVIEAEGEVTAEEVRVTDATGTDRVIATFRHTPSASPVASPMASPAASPMASPAATPVASPIATPAG